VRPSRTSQKAPITDKASGQNQILAAN